jgi:hypothetical protein
MLGVFFGLRGLGVQQAKAQFFDRNKVTNALDKATIKALSKAGAMIRRTARGLIRNRKRVSKPGQSPSNRTGLLKDNIFFVYDPSRRAVVVGPARLNGRASRNLVPRTLEFGGLVEFREYLVADATGNAFWTTNIGNNKSLDKSRSTHKSISPRPYMMPALMKNLPKIPAQFTNAVNQT